MRRRETCRKTFWQSFEKPGGLNGGKPCGNGVENLVNGGKPVKTVLEYLLEQRWETCGNSGGKSGGNGGGNCETVGETVVENP
jgi:hypothetical protein